MLLKLPSIDRSLKNRAQRALLSALLCLLSACSDQADQTEPAATSGRAVGEVFRDALRISGGDGPEMVVLPRQRFRMGDISGDGEEDERPVCALRLGQPIAMGQYEVTCEE